MGKLTDDEQKMLDELTKRASEPDADDDFEFEIYDSSGRGARLPFSKGKSWLFENFGIGDDPDAAKDEKDKKDKKDKQDPQAERTASPHYFGRNSQAG